MPSLTPSALVAVAISPSSPNLDEVTKSTCHAEDHRPKGNARVSGGPAPGAASALSSELVCPGGGWRPWLRRRTGRMISTPFSLAFSMISGTILAPSSSNSDEPIGMPSSTWQRRGQHGRSAEVSGGPRRVSRGQGRSGEVRGGQGRAGEVRGGQRRSGEVSGGQGRSGEIRRALRKVKAMPPPMMILSTLSHMFLMSRILSDTWREVAARSRRDWGGRGGGRAATGGGRGWRGVSGGRRSAP